MDTAAYEESFDYATQLRKTGQTGAALQFYASAAYIGCVEGVDTTLAWHMGGVCLTDLGRYGEAFAWLAHAKEQAARQDQRANIFRDLARTYMEIGCYDEAAVLLLEADLTVRRDPTIEAGLCSQIMATNCGYRGRLLLHRGLISEAVKALSQANDWLIGLGNETENILYNRVWYARALIQNGNWLHGRFQALRCLWEAHVCHSPKHSRRALVLLIGGWWSDAAIMKVRKML